MDIHIQLSSFMDVEEGREEKRVQQQSSQHSKQRRPAQLFSPEQSRISDIFCLGMEEKINSYIPQQMSPPSPPPRSFMGCSVWKNRKKEKRNG
jgi:hypothetical protein